jgi:hypothetical protein
MPGLEMCRSCVSRLSSSRSRALSPSSSHHANHKPNRSSNQPGPLDEDVTLEVTDGRSAPYRLPNPCRRTASGWVNFE